MCEPHDAKLRNGRGHVGSPCLPKIHKPENARKPGVSLPSRLMNAHAIALTRSGAARAVNPRRPTAPAGSCGKGRAGWRTDPFGSARRELAIPALVLTLRVGHFS